MKANKALKRLNKIEALISDVTERYLARAPHIRDVLQDAKAAVTRAKEAVSLQASSGKAKNPPVEDAKHPSKAMPGPSKPERKLSAAGGKAISEATKKRWDAKRVAAKPEPTIARRGTVEKTAAKKAAPVKAAKAPAQKVAKKAPAKKAVRLIQAAKVQAPPTIEDAAVKTSEQVAPEAPVQ
jgi:hypothetical protein